MNAVLTRSSVPGTKTRSRLTSKGATSKGARTPKAKPAKAKASAAATEKVSYKEMLMRALNTINSPRGSSMQAIQRHIESQHKVAVQKHHLKAAVAKALEAGDIRKSSALCFQVMSASHKKAAARAKAKGNAASGRTWVYVGFYNNSGCVPTNPVAFPEDPECGAIGQYFRGRSYDGQPRMPYDNPLPVLSLAEAKQIVRPLLKEPTDEGVFGDVEQRYAAKMERLDDDATDRRYLTAFQGGKEVTMDPDVLTPVCTVILQHESGEKIVLVLKSADCATLEGWIEHNRIPAPDDDDDGWIISELGLEYILYTREYMRDNEEDMCTQFEMCPLGETIPGR